LVFVLVPFLPLGAARLLLASERHCKVTKKGGLPPAIFTAFNVSDPHFFPLYAVDGYFNNHRLRRLNRFWLRTIMGFISITATTN
jgi:hypothetical protein